MANKLKDATPRPRIGKTAKDTRMARLIDVNQVVDEVNDELTVIEGEQVIQDMRITALESSGGGGSDYTETIVNITPTTTTYSDGRPAVASGILAMGDTPIELLPNEGVDKYSIIHEIIIEEIGGSAAYTFNGFGMSLTNSEGDFNMSMSGAEAGENEKRVFRINSFFHNNFLQPYLIGSEAWHYMSSAINSGLYLSTDTSENPTTGNGTLRVKIYHKTITFGA